MDQKPDALIVQCDAGRLCLPDRSVDLVLGSPPYAAQRTYGHDSIARDPGQWVTWMLDVTRECLRVSRSCVVWVVSGPQIGGWYTPMCEQLVCRWLHVDPANRVMRPLIWVKNAPPSGANWFSNDWEYLLVFTQDDRRPLYFDGPAVGQTIKYKAGGRFRQRKKDGRRSVGSEYPTHSLRKRPSNVLNVTVGGGHMGWSEATEVNEAPYPEALVAPVIRALTPVGGRVLDPFAGSGTTAAVCVKESRTPIAADIRMDQCLTTARRLSLLRRADGGGWVYG